MKVRGSAPSTPTSVEGAGRRTTPEVPMPPILKPRGRRRALLVDEVRDTNADPIFVGPGTFDTSWILA